MNIVLQVLNLGLSAKKLDKKDWFGKSDPFVTFSKVTSFLVHEVETRGNYLSLSRLVNMDTSLWSTELK